MGDVKVSVVMLAYNHEKYIEKAIESVLMQTVNFKYEIVIGEDCSQDGTRAIIEEYKEKYPELFITILQEENVGPTKNWYDVVMKSNGDYIANLEGDDYWIDPYKLQKQVDFLEAHSNYIGVAHDYEMVDKNGELISSKKVAKRFINAEFSIQDFFNELFVFQSATIVFKNLFSTDKSRSELVYKASPLVGDLTIMTILLDKGDFYILPDIMSAYRFVRKENDTNASSIGISNPMESARLSLNQISMIEKYFNGKYDLSQLKSRYFVGLLYLIVKYKRSSFFNPEVYRLYRSQTGRVRVMIINRIFQLLFIWPIKVFKR